MAIRLPFLYPRLCRLPVARKSVRCVTTVRLRAKRKESTSAVKRDQVTLPLADKGLSIMRPDNPPDVRQPLGDPESAFHVSSGNKMESDKNVAAATKETDQQNDIATTANGMKPAEYVHDFDSYAFVNRLHKDGMLTREQSVVLMKAIRYLLRRSVLKAKAHFLSRGELENEMYLFRAAMSELRNEIATIRKNEAASLRAETTTLLRDVDSLNQALREQTSDLENQIDIEVGNRKSVLRTEQKDLELQIQGLNNKIIVQILSDLRSELEQVRWVSTRRGLIAIFSIIPFFAFALFVLHRSAKKDALRESDVETVSSSMQTEADEDVLSKSDQLASFASLG